MKPFEERMRLEYDLKTDDTVLDVGSYEGNWTYEINHRYGCNVIVFEPCREFFDKIETRFDGNKKIEMHHAALGGQSRQIEIGVQGDSTGEFATSERRESVLMHDVGEFLIHKPVPKLIKINAEGAEYPIMERLLSLDITQTIQWFQIQFHSIVPNYQARYDAICAGLSKTHNRTFFAPFVWEGWTLK